jgi:segregation and condensation protein B
MPSDDHNRLIEAALFISSEPLGMGKISKIAGVNSLGYLKGVLLELRGEYEGRGFHLVESPRGWSFQVDHRFADKVANLTPYSDLPEGMKRTLALIAYKEPVKQSDIVRVQGSQSYAYIKGLAERGLVRAERQGRTKVLSLTKEFERYFGGEKEKIREKLIERLRNSGDDTAERPAGASVASPES